MNLVFSENTGEYLNKNSSKSISFSEKEKITELPGKTEKAETFINEEDNG